MALDPTAFLNGLDEGRFGKVEALKLWLHLQSDGFMDTDLPYEHVREKFEAAFVEESS